MHRTKQSIAAGLLVCLLAHAAVASPKEARRAESRDVLSRENLVVSGLVDSKHRSPELRAQMLEELGFKQVVLGNHADDETLDEQIKVMKRHGIEIFAWFLTDTDTPTLGIDWPLLKLEHTRLTLGELLETFKRHGMKPQLWVGREMQLAKSAQPSTKPAADMNDEDKNLEFRKYLDYDPTPPEERDARVRQEVAHFRPLMQLAASYGLDVALYKHGGWISIDNNMVDVIEGLKAFHINNVGIVYRLIHAHDEVDDTTNFSEVWTKIKPYVRVVDITGLHAGRTAIYPILYPSQGDLELPMLKIIQDSGWRGQIGVSGEKGADVGGELEVHLRNNLIGVDWLAAELRRPGSGGPRPLGHVP